MVFRLFPLFVTALTENTVSTLFMLLYLLQQMLISQHNLVGFFITSWGSIKKIPWRINNTRILHPWTRKQIFFKKLYILFLVRFLCVLCVYFYFIYINMSISNISKIISLIVENSQVLKTDSLLNIMILVSIPKINCRFNLIIVETTKMFKN